MDIQEAIHVLQDCGDAAKGTEFEQVYRMGAVALREQAEREKGCEYCDPCTADEEWRKNWTIEGKNSHDGGDVMSVNFCPICGRPLK